MIKAVFKYQEESEFTLRDCVDAVLNDEKDFEENFMTLEKEITKKDETNETESPSARVTWPT